MKFQRGLGALALVSFALSGCNSDQGFSQGGDAGGAVGIPCTTVLQNTTANLRIILMVDNSGSTQGGSGTDPNYHYRVSTVSDFVTKYSAKTNFSYGFGFFQGVIKLSSGKHANTADAVVTDFSTTPSTFVDPTAALPTTAFASSAASVCVPDGSGGCSSGSLSNYVGHYPADGDTPYDAAFAAIQAIVSADVAANAAGPYLYTVVFMSDGMPNPDLSLSQLKTLVTTLVNSVPGNRLNVNTVYFGPAASTGSKAATAYKNLVQMASYGNGNFVDTNTPGYTLAMADVTTVPGQVCVPAGPSPTPSPSPSATPPGSVIGI